MKNNSFGKLLCLLMAGTMAFGLAACSDEPIQGNGGEHEHKWSSTGTDNGNGTHKITCTGSGECDEGGSKNEAHDTKGADGKCSVCGYKDETHTEDTSTPLDSNATIYLVGDSTVCDYKELDMEYLPRSGYGTQLINYLNAQPSQIKNLALSGRSSLSFLQEPEYATLFDATNGIKSGDYLIIGFGHNDEKVGEEARYTDPNGTYQEETKNGSPSFQYTLYENYVKKAKDLGATPILCTPIVRCSTSTPLAKDKIHDTDTGDYAEAIRTLAKDTDTALIDMTAITKEIYESDIAEAQYFHRHSSYDGEEPNKTPAGIDNTHLNAYGAKVVAYALLHNIPDREDCKGLAASVKTNVSAPTHANDYASAIHPTYERPDYAPPTLSGAIYSTKSGEDDINWYAAAIGDNGGVTKHSATYDSATATFRVGNTKTDSDPAGKFTGAGDGFVAAFVQLPIDKNFEISAEVNLEEELRVDNQSAFGIMLRDDMYAPDNFKNLKSNYVAVGAFDNKAPSAIFYRRAEALTPESGTTTAFSTDVTYTLKLKRKGQTTDLEFSDGTNEYTKSYMDFAMNSIDSQYMYVCLFAARGVIANFSNVTLTILGDQTQED